eukprot:Polyplicarium_translucidae@DN3409_c2_g1_i1.p1
MRGDLVIFDFTEGVNSIDVEMSIPANGYRTFSLPKDGDGSPFDLSIVGDHNAVEMHLNGWIIQAVANLTIAEGGLLHLTVGGPGHLHAGWALGIATPTQADPPTTTSTTTTAAGTTRSTTGPGSGPGSAGTRAKASAAVALF